MKEADIRVGKWYQGERGDVRQCLDIGPDDTEEVRWFSPTAEGDTYAGGTLEFFARWAMREVRLGWRKGVYGWVPVTKKRKRQ